MQDFYAPNSGSVSAENIDAVSANVRSGKRIDI